MLDIKQIRENYTEVVDALSSRGVAESQLIEIKAADEQWREVLLDLEKMRAERIKIKGKPTPEQLDTMKQEAERIKLLEQQERDKEQALKNLLLNIPNIPDATTPMGKSEADNVEVRKWGEPVDKGFTVKAHDEIGVDLGVLNFEEAGKISGSRFVIYHDAGARLERALINFMLDTHVAEHGFREVMTPALVNANALLGTGNLPKFAEDLFACKDDDLYLIPTAEVTLTNLHSGELLTEADLPKYYAAYTPCFRREAGSYGKDTKGIIRQHQFNKVEMVKLCRPEDSAAELEHMTNCAEKILQKLELPYRVVALSTGDIGFSAAKTYDIEVWFPFFDAYREISSCSNCHDFQARRANIRYKNSEGKNLFLHTLNGSGLAVGRCLAAILENYQEADGSVKIPEVLIPYMGGITKIER